MTTLSSVASGTAFGHGTDPWRRGVLRGVVAVSFFGSGLVTLLAVGCSARNPYIVQADASPWVRALGSDDLFESDPAEDRLVSFGPAVVPALATALQREPPAVRVGVVAVLWRLQLAEADRLLVRTATEDPDEDVRYEAVRVLDDVHDPGRVAVLESALDDPSERVRLAAVQRCSTLCSSAPALERLVDSALTDSAVNADWAHASVERILGEEGSARAAVARSAIDRQAPAQMHAAVALEQRVRAALLLADVADGSGVGVLVEGATNARGVRLRQHALFALGGIAGAAAVPGVAALLHDLDPTIVAYSRDTLRRMAARDVPGANLALGEAAGTVPAAPLPRPFP